MFVNGRGWGQVADVCHLLANTSELQQGYNAIGFSQGDAGCLLRHRLA